MNPRIRLVALLVGAVLTVALTTSLGFWQLRRAAEKIALQQAMDDQGAKAPLTATQLRQAADLLRFGAPARAFARHLGWLRLRCFWITGKWRPRSGFFVLTPLVLEGGGAVLVQRGWAPRNFENRTQLPQVETPSGVVDVEGRIGLAAVQAL